MPVPNASLILHTASQPPLTRRHLLRGAVALAAASLATPMRPRGVQAQARFTGYPFTLGVASGCPLPDSVVLWTRLAPEPLAGGGIEPGRALEVRWEVAADEHFTTLVQQGKVWAAHELGHSVHVEVQGLEPARWYWYRFLVGEEVSPVGRTRTAPAVGTMPERLRWALASCQHYEQGYFSAYRHMAEDDIELVLFVGDYIYESAGREQLVRRHAGPEPYTLVEYRNRYAQYHTDPDLQRMHALAPWLVTWDDHEVDNDYANDQSEHLDPQFLSRRAAAYQAYYEHMPLRPSARPRGPHLRLYERYTFGNLLQVYLLDARQYRSPQACPRPGIGGSTTVQATQCPDLRDPARTLLGSEQEAWLLAGLRASHTRWNVLAQQTLMAQVDQHPGPGQSFWTDGWDGYPVARNRLLTAIADIRPANPLVLGGDVHSYWVCDLKPDFDNPQSPVVATEVCGTSITSQGLPQERLDAWRAENPHVKFARSDTRGYVQLDITPERCLAHLRGLDSVKKRSSTVTTLASYMIDNGRPGATLA
ncbi:MAG: alkaline phosphatase [Candidatus Tectomicrobia bacterium]|uniref:Alkaline phosphatase n=1 Tax=Tectimicrobiota bacterium TaxID=2528274 RepID=A0A938B0V5_UNCTE|nr:alkaline phosphatase [Candidatus Tectomicrobia bacterium]